MNLANDLLHVAAKIAVRIWPPIAAKRRVDALGSMLPAVGVDEAEDMSRHLRGGTCLTRSLAIAARIPGSEVVIGASRVAGSPLDAHAWVEARGKCIGQTESKTELARLR